MFARATSAWCGSYSSVIRRPPSGSARASQIVLYPPSVPISRIFRDPFINARMCNSFPCGADTWMVGRPPSSLAFNAKSSASSGGRRVAVM